MMFSRIASWIRSLRGEEAEDAARKLAKPTGMSRRAFLASLGLTTATVLFGDVSIALPSYEDEPTTSTDSVWSTLLNQSIGDFLRYQEAEILRQRKLMVILQARGRIEMPLAVTWKFQGIKT